MFFFFFCVCTNGYEQPANKRKLINHCACVVRIVLYSNDIVEHLTVAIYLSPQPILNVLDFESENKMIMKNVIIELIV